MTKITRLKRPDLVEQIVKRANLPPCKETKGYFTIEQLKELLIKLDTMIQTEVGNGQKKACLSK